jgi:phage gp46-like protein
MSERQRIVSDKSAELALHWLHENALAMGKAVEAARLAEHMIKHVLHIQMKLSDEKTAAGKERDAYASKEYRDAILADAKAAGALAILRSQKEVQALKIEAWRTEQANYRAMKI